MDRDTGWCLGCGRTIGEITGWPDATEAEKRAIVARLDARRRRLHGARSPNRR